MEAYETKDTELVLPVELHNAAIQYAQEMTGIYRPVREHQVYINAFRECFIAMKKLQMVKEEFQNEPKTVF